MTIPAGQTSGSFNVPIINDAMAEPNETVNLTLSDPVNATLGTPSTAVLTITDDDPTPTVAFSSATYSVGEAGGSAIITVNLTNPRSIDIQVNYSTSNGTATTPVDYTATSGTLTIPAGQTSGSFTVPIINDTMDEPNETVNLTLSNPVNATLGSPSTAVLTIIDDDPMPVVAFSSASYSVNEQDGTATITVTLTGLTANNVSVNFATANGTATSPADYTANSGTLTIPAGQTSGSFTVPIINDTMDESDETVNLTLSSPVNATLGTPSTAILTILDDDPIPIISLCKDSFIVGEANPEPITVCLSNPSSSTVTVNYATSDGTATTPSDYTATSGSLTFATGETSKIITVPVSNDSMDEPDKYFYITLSSPVNATLGIPSTATLWIIDDDPTPTITFSSATYSVGEAEGMATITVCLSNPSSSTVTVHYATGDGTAIAPSDYTATSGTLTFALGETCKTFTVPIINDSMDEVDETINLTLSSPVNATLGTPSTAVVTIIDDDGFEPFRIFLPVVVRPE